MCKYKSGFLTLLVILFAMPWQALAKPDRLQILQSAAIGGEVYTCYTTNTGGEGPVSVTVTLLDPVGGIIRQSQFDNNPGNTHETDFAADQPNARCVVEWFGQSDDLIGSFCARLTDGTGKACLQLR